MNLKVFIEIINKYTFKKLFTNRISDIKTQMFQIQRYSKYAFSEQSNKNSIDRNREKKILKNK